MTKSYFGHKTLMDGTHVPLTEDEAKDLWEQATSSKNKRAEKMPEVQDALEQIQQAQQRMRELGWHPGGGLPVEKGGKYAVVEFGSTGVFSGILDKQGKYFDFAGGCSLATKVWAKRLSELTLEERAYMEMCDRDNNEWLEGEFDRWSY